MNSEVSISWPFLVLGITRPRVICMIFFPVLAVLDSPNEDNLVLHSNLVSFRHSLPSVASFWGYVQLSYICLQTGTGFIKVERPNGSAFSVTTNRYSSASLVRCTSNPATNDWIPSSETVWLPTKTSASRSATSYILWFLTDLLILQVIPASNKPSRSDSWPDFPPSSAVNCLSIFSKIIKCTASVW